MRSVGHGDVPQGRHAQLQAPQAAADQAEAHVPLARDDGEYLQGGAPLEQESEVLILHGDQGEEELLEVGKGDGVRQSGGVRELPGANVQAGERGAAEERGGETEVERPRAVDKGELLDVTPKIQICFEFKKNLLK